MTKEELGEKLAALRDGAKLDCDLSGYAIESIEFGRSSYPVSNLVSYCNASGIVFRLVDHNVGDGYQIHFVEDVHDVLALFMKRYDTDEKMLYRITGVHYTTPRNGRASLSINTLLSVCRALFCDIVVEKEQPTD